MSATIEADSTLTDRYQTTVPETVRRALKLGKRDKIHYAIRPDGAVLLSRANPENGESDDPVMRAFLGFLADDMVKHPQRLRALDKNLLARIKPLVKPLTGRNKINLDAPLLADDE
jgi:antitoxin PrlF